MKTKSLLIMIFSIVFFISCSDDDDNNCINYEEAANVTAVEAPDVATVNEPVNVQVDFNVNNACGEFEDFNVTVTDMTRTIEVQAVYEGCACAQVITPRSVVYTFTPEQAGEHTLRFRSGQDQIIEETILVEEATSPEE